MTMEETIVERKIERETAKVNGRDVEMVTETTRHADGRQDIKIHLPAISMISNPMKDEDG